MLNVWANYAPYDLAHKVQGVLDHHLASSTEFNMVAPMVANIIPHRYVIASATISWACAQRSATDNSLGTIFSISAA